MAVISGARPRGRRWWPGALAWALWVLTMLALAAIVWFDHLRRYDAAQTIQAFSGRLRQQVDLATLTAELLAVVEQTMQPSQVSLWLRPPRAPSRATVALRPRT